MRTLPIETATLREVVDDAQADRVVITRGNAPVALVIAIRGLDMEDLELCLSSEF